jgi:hypothetical protein
MFVSANSIADRISSALPNVKAGSLRTWGEWFGKPHDNFHTIKGCSSTDTTLILEFDGGETLTVENPEGLVLSNTLFSIRSASAVQWEWFYYGRPHIADNRYYYRFTRNVRCRKAVTGDRRLRVDKNLWTATVRRAVAAQDRTCCGEILVPRCRYSQEDRHG